MYVSCPNQEITTSFYSNLATSVFGLLIQRPYHIRAVYTVARQYRLHFGLQLSCSVRKCRRKWVRFMIDSNIAQLVPHRTFLFFLSIFCTTISSVVRPEERSRSRHFRKAYIKSGLPACLPARQRT